MNFNFTQTLDSDELSFDIELELECTLRGEPPTMPSMKYPGEPGFGPEFKIEEGIEVNGVEMTLDFFASIFGQDCLDRITETAETKAAESGEFG